ncbi:protein FAR-RED IMPAIRED RESPONSE 1-like [Hevea brasiliensis]|uniref:protein FAR-RED IMPAIRED RESPONSE 1-like n=1 Tax=Hevea brasiliensis TaxID=3981 RepID=UPI0025F13969|nr:protein FAR-RED IMPAIRED RESPONSE 1-like [Hevea brasiliensis]
MEVENERRRRELYDTLGIRDDDSLFDANSLSDEPSNGTNGTPSHGYEEGPIEESQSGSDGQCSNVHENEIPYNVEEGPKTGMHFPTMDDLVNFYKHHARLKGFSIVIRSSSKGNSLVPKYVLITCDKGSKPHSDPSMSRFMTHHRGLSNIVKRSLEANDIARIRPSKSIRLLEVQFGGPEKMGCFPKNCRNFVNSRRMLRLDDEDAESIRKLFCRLQVIESSFFYAIDVDWECRLRNMLWIHLRGRAAYEEFHDVICFDTTYLVNRYRMPFATFVGVNHHGQSILLGCALLSHEDVETFKCVLSTWLSAMVDIHPHAILTDQ